jgi:NAD(P)-dependent dehydrogenase (short-subunit alcohol dehydrogenase family)
MVRLKGKIALVTGGTSGIGLAPVKAFVNEGTYAFITGRREGSCLRRFKDIGRNVMGVQGDASNLGDLDRLFAVECYGANTPTIRRIFEARLSRRAFPVEESESAANHAHGQHEQVHS